MIQTMFLGAGLALAFLMVWLRGLLINHEYRNEVAQHWRRGWRIVFAELILATEGTAIITYTSKFAGFGTATAPTAIQASQLVVQTAQINFADADTVAVVTHNWGSLPGSASFASFLFPEIFMYCAQTTTSGASFVTNFTFGISNTNSITINKVSIGTGSGGTFNLIMRLPQSIGG